MLDGIEATHVLVRLVSYGTPHESGCRLFSAASVTAPVNLFLHVPSFLCDHVIEAMQEEGDGYIAVVPVDLVIGAVVLN